ncbi:Rieske 2Fe-2S domain-containing protein [Pusillimonas sp.]|uniref:Rieske 2Fe-2S domain-containing protein n=1 Tax=Pusillimonas sp. TaxID=3040095 RepID=UPI0037CA13CF
MAFLRNAWYVAMWSENLGQGRLESKVILNEPVVFFRQEDGEAVAMADRCPHRFAPLSMGSLCGDRLRCSYHGLEFDASGECIHNPHDSKKTPAAMKVATYSVIERHSIVWIWMGDQAADPDLIPDLSVLATSPPEHTSPRDYIKINASYELIVYNLLDLSHVPFLHGGVLGNADMIRADTSTEQAERSLTAQRSMPNIRISRFHQLLLGITEEVASDSSELTRRYQAQLHNKEGRGDAWADMTWHAPSCLMNDSGVCPPGEPRSQGTGALGAHLLTPETDTTTHYFFCAVRNNPVPLSPEEEVSFRAQLGDLRRIAFDEQDRPILEGQQRNLDLAGGNDSLKPVLLPIDSSAVRCQRILEQLIHEESQPG